MILFSEELANIFAILGPFIEVIKCDVKFGMKGVIIY